MRTHTQQQQQQQQQAVEGPWKKASVPTDGDMGPPTTTLCRCCSMCHYQFGRGSTVITVTFKNLCLLDGSSSSSTTTLLPTVQTELHTQLALRVTQSNSIYLYTYASLLSTTQIANLQSHNLKPFPRKCTRRISERVSVYPPQLDECLVYFPPFFKK